MKRNKKTPLHKKSVDILLIALCGAAAPAEDFTNKLDYDFFHPTPTNQMRCFDTDRPSKTDVAFTVDAGHFQLETDFANYTHNANAGVRQDVWQAGSNFNLKAGILNDLDFQVILGNYVHADTLDQTSGQHTVNQGFGDTTLRLKYNLYGNDGGCTALALLPYLKCPTDTGGTGNHAFEGGLNVPFAWNLPCGFALNAETGAGIFRNDDNDRTHLAFNNSVILYHKIYGDLEGYAEFYSSVSSRARDPWAGTADFGVIYQLTENIALDLNTAIGVTRGASDYNIFSGIGVRF